MIVSIIFELSFDHIKFVSPKSYQLKNDPALSKNYEFLVHDGQAPVLISRGILRRASQAVLR